MTTTDEAWRAFGGQRQRTGRVALAAFALACDTPLVLYAIAVVALGWLSRSEVDSAELALAGAVVVLGIGTFASIWLASEFRGYRLVLTVALGWVLFWGVAAAAATWRAADIRIPESYPAAALVWHIAAALFLWSGRVAFRPVLR